jgi:hypothetical protein
MFGVINEHHSAYTKPTLCTGIYQFICWYAAPTCFGKRVPSSGSFFVLANIVYLHLSYTLIIYFYFHALYADTLYKTTFLYHVLFSLTYSHCILTLVIHVSHLFRFHLLLVVFTVSVHPLYISMLPASTTNYGFTMLFTNCTFLMWPILFYIM